ncbi:MAG: sugar phosphate isomerase/epimerase [Clostridia bacterium]|nr:sugar phosphate isomerase/epimerase [Clostridia bacterium]
MSKFVISGFADEAAKYLDQQMDVLDPIGIRYIELRGCGDKNIGALTREEAEALAKKMADRGYKVSAIGSGVGKTKIDSDMDVHFNFFMNNLLMAQIFDAPYVRMFSFYPDEMGTPISNYRDKIMFQWERYLREADKVGVKLLHENEGGIYGQYPFACRDLAETLGIGLIFDPANFIQSGVTTFPDAFRILQKYVKYMHIKDCRMSDGQVQPCGYGDGKIEKIFVELDKMGYEGFLSLEPHLSKFDGFDGLEFEGGKKQAIFAMSDSGAKTYNVAAEALFATLRKVGLEPSFEW